MIIKTKDTIAKVDKIKLDSKFNKGTELQRLQSTVQNELNKDQEVSDKIIEWKKKYFVEDYYTHLLRYTESSYYTVLVATAYKKELAYIIDFYYRNSVVYSIEYPDLDIANAAFRSISEDIINEDSIINL